MLLCLVISVPLYLAALLFGLWRMDAAERAGSLDAHDSDLAGPLLLMFGYLCACVLGIVAHELVHGTMMRAAGGRPRYGVRVVQGVYPIIYAHCDETVLRIQALTITLAPTITALLAAYLVFVIPPVWALWLSAAVATSLAGSVGDWWMAICLLGEPPQAFIQDHPTEVGYRLVQPVADPPSDQGY